MAAGSDRHRTAGWSLRRLVLTWATAAGLALVALHTWGALKTLEEAAWLRAEAQAATELARLSVVAERLAVSDRSVVTELLVHATLQESITLALLVDPAHRVRSASAALDQDRPLAETHPEWVSLVRETAQADTTVVRPDRALGTLLTARGIAWPALPGELRGQQRGAVLIVTDVGRTVAALRAQTLLTKAKELSVLLLAGALLLLALDRLVTKPLGRLRALATAIGEGRFDQAVPPSNIQELQALGLALGRMRDDLQATLLRVTDSEQRYRDLARSAPDAIVTAGADGRIGEFNQAAERLFGYTAAEVAGQPLDLLLPEHLAATHARHLAGFGEAQEPAARRMAAGRLVAGRHRSGRALQLEIGISRSRVGGAVTFAAMIRDVSDRALIETELEAYRRRLEEQVHLSALELTHERDRAQGATRAKSEFLANMGHELRTPLNVIIGLAHVAAREAGPSGAAQLAQIEQAAIGLLGVVNDVLDFSRLEAGHIALVEAEVSLWHALHAVCEPLAATAAARGVQVLEQVDPAVPARVLVDDMRLRQVLGHLVGNAVKFTSSGHVLVHVQPAPVAGCWRFEVSDTGIGITPEVLAHLFEPFEPGDSSEARRFGGAGIGLVISQRLLRLMGANLRARSQAGVGSTFWFDLALPAPAPTEPPRQPVVAPSPATPALRVLVVDASAVAAAAAQAVLQTLGHRAQTCLDAPSAIQALHAAERADEPFQLCLVDAGTTGGHGRELGDCGGFDIGRQLDDAGLLAPPPRLLIALRNAPIALSMVLRQRFEGLLHKPLTPDTLAQRLAVWWQVPAGAPDSPWRAPAAEPTPWAGIAGLDPGLALRSLRQDPAAYADQVRQFLTLHRHHAVRLAQLAAGEGAPDPASLAHAVQASAAAIGAHRVAGLAETLATALDGATRSGGAHDAASQAEDLAVAASHAGHLARALASLVVALDKALPAGPPSGAPTPARRPTAGTALPLADPDLRQTLAELLARRDMSALRLVRAQPEAVQALLGTAAPGLLAAIAAFDFDTALHLLQTRQATPAPGSLAGAGPSPTPLDLTQETAHGPDAA